MATHSSVLAWEIPWTDEPRRLQFMGLERPGLDQAINTNTEGGKERSSKDPHRDPVYLLYTFSKKSEIFLRC